jgi:thiol-disulfide isomerase/thioredoxin
MTDAPSKRRRWLLATAGGLALAAGAGAALWRTRVDVSTQALAAVDDLFAHTFPDADGRPQALQQWRGRWLIVNFWATWCAPCVEEMPLLQRIADEYASRGVAVVGLGIDSASAIARFRSELRLTIPLLVAGADGVQLGRVLGNPSGALPYTVLISPEGGVAQARLGLLKEDLLRAWLDRRVAA